MINRLRQRFDKLVEVFFVQENFVTVVTVIIKTFTAFRDRQVIIITTCSSYIKKVSPTLTSPDPLAVNAFHFLVVVVVRHSRKFYRLKIVLVFICLQI